MDCSDCCTTCRKNVLSKDKIPVYRKAYHPCNYKRQTISKSIPSTLCCCLCTGNPGSRKRVVFFSFLMRLSVMNAAKPPCMDPTVGTHPSSLTSTFRKSFTKREISFFRGAMPKMSGYIAATPLSRAFYFGFNAYLGRRQSRNSHLHADIFFSGSQFDLVNKLFDIPV